jgi:hypothetical protein
MSSLESTFGEETYVHVGSSNDELASQLEEFGMNKAGLPKYVNGKWGLVKYIQWQECRARMEFKQFAWVGEIMRMSMMIIQPSNHIRYFQRMKRQNETVVFERCSLQTKARSKMFRE